MSFMKDGFLRVSAAAPAVKVADCDYNAGQIVALAKEAAGQGASLVVFPELCLTGATCGDLFLQRSLLQAAEDALFRVAEETAGLECVVVVGLPAADRAALYNCAAVLCRGEILGLVPKSVLPCSGEVCDARYFSQGEPLQWITKKGKTFLMGTDLLFSWEEVPEFVLGVEFGKELWESVPPSCDLTGMGATVIASLAAECEMIGKAEYRRSMVTSQSARTVSAYVYADAGEGESTTDMVFSGHRMIAENGRLLAESKPFASGVLYADIDVQQLCGERRKRTDRYAEKEAHEIPFSLPARELRLQRAVLPMPFLPERKEDLDKRCEEIFTLQTMGLSKRLQHTFCKTAVIGLSGGLDSTLALLVVVKAFDHLGLDRKGIVAVSMPCFGTTSRTKGNAQILAESLGTTFREIPIADAVNVHLRDIGQDPEKLDVTYENAQARERTQVLMDIANQMGGMVIGTGDLSELALGWATYNGDHMSMYGVNASVPKTLVRHLVKYQASLAEGALSDVLLDILDTPVSPELLPPKDGEIAQKTESIVGPYELHDFFLYYILRYGFAPGKIYRLACYALGEKYGKEEILKWLRIFYRRFFTQQFKRSCLPDGPKVGTVGVSPRGDWKMPSDASFAVWMTEIDQLS